MRNINWTYYTTKTIVNMFMIGAAAISFSHIVDVATTAGLTWEAWTVPFFVDGIALLGKIGRSKRFTETTQRAGLYLMGFGGLLSLGANVAAGDNLGQQGYGVLVVVGFVLTEWYAGKLEAAPAPTTEQAKATKPSRTITEQEKAARKRAGYAKMTAPEKAAWTKAYVARIARTAPSSPAVGYAIPTVAELLP